MSTIMANLTKSPSICLADSTCEPNMLIVNSLVIAVVFVFGIPGNCLILRVYWTKARKTSTHVLIMALAWADLSVCLSLTVNIAGLILKCGGNGTDFTFLIIAFTGKIGVAASFAITAVIAGDRYDAICRPQRRFFTPRRAKVAVFVVVLFAVIVNFPEGISKYLYPPSPGVTLLVPIIKTVAVLIALVTIGLCYGKVYATILRHVKVGANRDRSLRQDDPVAAKINQGRTKSSTKLTLPRRLQLNVIQSHTAKRGNGSERNAKCSAKPTTHCLSRIDANMPIVDNDVSTVNLPNTICTTPASTSRCGTFDIPQNVNGKRVKSAEDDSKVALANSVSQEVSEQGRRCGDRNHFEETNTLRRHTPKRIGGTALHRKTTKMLFITSVVFLLTWLPDLTDNAIIIAHLTGSSIDINDTVCNIFNLLHFTLFINNAINPLIYGLANKRFRKDCKEVFRKFRR